MINTSLLIFKKNVFSQNGEDGIIKYLFELINPQGKICCEFGAWDGIHLSNCRQLILEGWRGLLIESDKERFSDLIKTYKDNLKVKCVNELVDLETNKLESICNKNGIQEIDFLSIDIDGFDFEVFESLLIFPLVICVEVNAGHSPDKLTIYESNISKNNVGQSLAHFTKVATNKGYSLVCYTGNAFYVRNDILGKHKEISTISNEEAYLDFLHFLSKEEKEWLYLVNKGLVEPHFHFQNKHLSRKNLKINFSTSIALIIKSVKENLLNNLSSPKIIQ